MITGSRLPKPLCSAATADYDRNRDALVIAMVIGHNTLHSSGVDEPLPELRQAP